MRRAALGESLAKAGSERKNLVQAGGETYQRLSLSLRAKLGPKSETPLRFGVSPRKTRRRKGASPTPVETQPPAMPVAKAAEPASSLQA